MHRLLSLFLLSALISVELSACKPQESQSTQSNQASQGAQPSSAAHTIVKQEGPIQVAFDISTMAAHQAMMKSMQMQMEHNAKHSHYITVTLMNHATQTLLKDVPIKIKVLDPQGKSLGDAAGEAMETMSGGGMYHYGHGYDFQAKGPYQIFVMFKVDGQVHTVQAQWELK